MKVKNSTHGFLFDYWEGVETNPKLFGVDLKVSIFILKTHCLNGNVLNILVVISIHTLYTRRIYAFYLGYYS